MYNVDMYAFTVFRGPCVIYEDSIFYGNARQFRKLIPCKVYLSQFAGYVSA